MAEQLLDRANVVARLEEMRREAVAQRVRRRRLDDSGAAHGTLHRPLHALLLELMAPPPPRPRIPRQRAGRENILPTPVARRARVLPGERKGQLDLAVSGEPVLVVELTRLSELLP